MELLAARPSANLSKMYLKDWIRGSGPWSLRAGLSGLSSDPHLGLWFTHAYGTCSHWPFDHKHDKQLFPSIRLFHSWGHWSCWGTCPDEPTSWLCARGLPACGRGIIICMNPPPFLRGKKKHQIIHLFGLKENSHHHFCLSWAFCPAHWKLRDRWHCRLGASNSRTSGCPKISQHIGSSKILPSCKDEWVSVLKKQEVHVLGEVDILQCRYRRTMMFFVVGFKSTFFPYNPVEPILYRVLIRFWVLLFAAPFLKNHWSENCSFLMTNFTGKKGPFSFGREIEIWVTQRSGSCSLCSAHGSVLNLCSSWTKVKPWFSTTLGAVAIEHFFYFFLHGHDLHHQNGD